MASLYEMAQGPDFDPTESFFAGRSLAYQNNMQKNKLAELARADQARPLIGNALMGNQGAMKSLAGIDPNAYMDVGKYQSGQAKAQREISDAEKQQIVGALYAADTPEKWTATINWLKQNGHDVEPEAMDFANRDALMGASLGAAGMMKADQWQKGYGLDQMNAETSRMNAEKAARQVEDKRRTQITEVDGQRVVVDLDSGQIIQRLGAAPVRGRSGPSATELKARYEAEDNNSMLDASLQTLSEAEAILGDGQTQSDVLEGYTAGVRGEIGAKAPWVANKLGIATPQQGLATAEYGRIMNAEAIKQMSEQLKGATTDRELQKFQDNLADPTVPNSIKRNTIKRMKALLDRKLKLNASRIKEITGGEQGQAYPGADGVTNQDMGGTFSPDMQFPPGAIEDLTADPSPEARAEFDAVFGQGASAQILGQ